MFALIYSWKITSSFFESSCQLEKLTLETIININLKTMDYYTVKMKPSDLKPLTSFFSKLAGWIKKQKSLKEIAIIKFVLTTEIVRVLR